MGRRLQEWGRKRLVKGAITARERGESVYVHRVVTSGEAVRNTIVAAIEAEGWKLADMQENPGNPRERWTLTFHDAGQPAASDASA